MTNGRRLTSAALLAMAAGLAAATGALAQKQFYMKSTERAQCRLSNAKNNREIYQGGCIVTENNQGRRQSFVIRMRGNEPITLIRYAQGEYFFAGAYGETQVRYADRGETGVFRWDDMRLEITQQD